MPILETSALALGALVLLAIIWPAVFLPELMIRLISAVRPLRVGDADVVGRIGVAACPVWWGLMIWWVLQ